MADPNDPTFLPTQISSVPPSGGSADPAPSSGISKPDEAQESPPSTEFGGINPGELFARALDSVKMSSAGGSVWQPPPMPEIARLFPGYEVLRLLGRGGMGAVYEARQIELDRFVAIKLLPLEISVDKDFADRFRREARAMAKLDHPNIIAVYDFGTTREGHLFFVMAYIEGANLYDLIHGGAVAGAGDPGHHLAPEQALALVEQICAALAYAHGKGIVHRDIKPANVMVDMEGHVKVADFGLARLIDTAASDLGHTMTGTVMGTPDYMAPEQSRGMNVDHRADIYSVGVMLYEMLCGEVPKGVFQAPSHRTGCDIRLDEIVIKAMQQAPDHRYQTTQELQAAVQTARVPSVPAARALAVAPPRALQAVPRPAGPVSAAGKRRRRLLAVGIVAVLAASGLFFFGKWKPLRVSAARPATPVPALEPGAIKLWNTPEQIPQETGIRWENGAVCLDGAALQYRAVRARDTILRAEIRMNPTDKVPPELAIRHRATRKIQPGEHTEDCYLLEVNARDDTARLESLHLGKATTLQTWPLPRVYGPDEWIEIELRAVGDAVSASAGGKLLGTVHDDSQPEAGVVQIYSGPAGYFRNIVYVPLDKPGAAAASPVPVKEIAPSYPQPAQWIDATNEVGRRMVNSKAAVLEGDGLRITKGGDFVAVADGREFHNAVVRMSCLHDATIFLHMRDKVRYTGQAGRYGGGAILLIDPAQVGNEFAKRADGIPGPGFDPDAEHELVFAAQDDKLTLWVDGVEKTTLRDSTLARGAIGVQVSTGSAATGQVRVRKVEYAELPETPSAVATAQTDGQKANTFATATKDAPFVNSLGMKFVPVPITGGSTAGQRVLFSIWETRVQDYQVFATETKREWPASAFPQGSLHPAVQLNWEDAQAFCAWLTQRERQAGKLGANERYRLPTDHEWSCAVMIGDLEDPAKLPSDKDRKLGNVYPWGDTWPPPPGAGNYSGEESAGQKLGTDRGILAGYSDDFPATAPVGSFAPNRLGLFDLGGNAKEWCEDWYEASQEHRVLRGASYRCGVRDLLLSSYRERGLPVTRYFDLGFRVVLATSDAVSAAATKDAPFVNSLGMKFVPVPIIGGPTDGQRVLFSIWETRVQDYKVFVTETHVPLPLPVPGFPQGPLHPALMVSWEDAQAFCTWLTQRERKAGKLSAIERYRLPSDHEWSCAVKIGDLEDAAKMPEEKDHKIEDVYPWGNTWPPPPGAGNYGGEERTEYVKDGSLPFLAGYRDDFPTSAPVGSFAANRLGVFDLGGNAREWCEDWFEAAHEHRAVRGASFRSSSRGTLLSSARDRDVPATRYLDLGFRVVLATDPAP